MAEFYDLWDDDSVDDDRIDEWDEWDEWDSEPDLELDDDRLARLAPFLFSDVGTDAPDDLESIDILDDGSLRYAPSGMPSLTDAPTFSAATDTLYEPIDQYESDEPEPDTFDGGIPTVDLALPTPPDAIALDTLEIAQPEPEQDALEDLQRQAFIAQMAADEQRQDEQARAEMWGYGTDDGGSTTGDGEASPPDEPIEPMFAGTSTSIPSGLENGIALMNGLVAQATGMGDLNAAAEQWGFDLGTAIRDGSLLDAATSARDALAELFIDVARGDKGAAEALQEVGGEAWQNIMAIWQSGNITTAPIKDLFSVETPLGSAGDLAATAAGANLVARMPAPPVVKAPIALIATGLTIAKSPIVNDIVGRLEQGMPIDDAATQSLLESLDRMGESATKALQMVEEDWVRAQPILDAIARHDYEAARDLTAQIGAEQFDVYSARKAGGVDPGIMGEFLADFYGAPQLNALFANPITKRAVHGLFNVGQKAIGHISQTPMGAGLVAGNRGANRAMAAIVESADRGVTDALFNAPDDAIGILKNRVHDLISVTPHPPSYFKHTPSGSVAVPSDAEGQLVEWLGSRIGKDGSWPLLKVFDDAADSKAGKDPLAFVSRLRSDAISVVRNEALADFDDMMTKQRVLPGVIARAAGGSIRAAAKMFELPNRILAPLYLNTASYLYGNTIEAFARQYLGNGRVGMMNEESYRRYFPMFARHAPPSLLSDDAINQARRSAMPNPLINQRLFDASNYVENGARRLYFVDRAQAHLDNLIKGSHRDIQRMDNDVRTRLAEALKGADPDTAQEFIRSARMAALVGPEALDAVHQQALNGRFRAAAVNDLAKRWSDFPVIGQIIREAASTGNPDVMAAARAKSGEALMHNVGIIAEGRSKQLADEIIPQFVKALDDGLAKFNPKSKDHVDWLRGMAGDLIRLQRMAQDHADNVHKADMLLQYYRKTTGPQRQRIARAAAAHGDADLSGLHGQILPLIDRVGAQMDAVGMPGATYSAKSREYVSLVREYHHKLAEATKEAFDEMNAGKIRRLDLMDAISAKKSVVDAQWTDILRSERDALDAARSRASGARASVKAPPLGKSGVPKKLDRDVMRPELALESFDPRHAVISQKASNLQDAMLSMIRHHDDLWNKIDDVVAKDPMNDPTVKANLAAVIADIQSRQAALPTVVRPIGVGLLDKAGQMAKDDYILNFPNYDQQNFLTYLAQLMIPFFRYEAFRWPYLVRTGLTRPTLPFAYQDFWDRTDAGYTALPTMPAMEQLLSLGGVMPNAVAESFGEGGFQYFPLGGTIAAGVRGITRGDFPANNALDKRAFEAATGKAGPEPTEQEKKWLRQPVLRDLVAAKRMFEGTIGAESADVQSGSYERWSPELKAFSGTAGQAKRLGERYGFYVSPIPNALDAASKGTLGSVLGPVFNAIAGGIAVSPVPVANSAALNAMSTGWLKDDFRENQVRHILADKKIDPDRATPSQWDDAYKEAIQREVFAEQVAGLRYRSPERIQFEERRREVTNRVLADDQKERLYQETGTTDLREALKILNQQNRDLDDIFDSPSLALKPDQRAAFTAVPDYQLRQKASEPFRDETGKALSNYYDYRQRLYDDLERDLTVRAGWLDRHKDDRGRAYTPRDFLRDQREGESRIIRGLQDLLEHNKEYEGVQGLIDQNREKRNLSLQDKLASEWFGLSEQATGSTGEVMPAALSRLQQRWVQEKMTEADRMAIEMGDVSLRDALSDFMRARRDRQERYTPGYAEAKALNDQFYATVPRYRGVPAGSEKQDQIDAALDLYRRYVKDDPRGGEGVGDRSLRRMMRTHPEEAMLARAYRKRVNEGFSRRRRQLMRNENYRRWYGEDVEDDGRAAAEIRQAIETKPTLDDMIERATLQRF